MTVKFFSMASEPSGIKLECCEMLGSSKISTNLILNVNMKEITKKEISGYVVI
jgi:hypothetical protein